LAWMISGTSLSPCQALESGDPRIVNLDRIEYHAGSPLHGEGDGISELKNWKPVSEFDNDDLAGRHDLWLKVTLPKEPWKEPALMVHAFLNDITVYMAGRRVYHGDGEENHGGKDFRFRAVRVILLRGFRPGMDVFIHTSYPSREGVGELYSLAAGETADILEELAQGSDELLSGGIRDACFGILLIVTGAGAFFVYAVRWREKDHPFLAFGLFSTCVGLAYLADANGLAAINISPRTHFYLKTCSFYMVPAGLFAFFGTLFRLNTFPARIVTALCVIHAAAAIAVPFYPSIGLDHEVAVLAVMVAGCAACVVIALSSKGSATDIRTLFIFFFTVFSALTAAHLMEVLGLIPAAADLFGWGMVLFVLGLGHMLVRHYTRTFKAMQTVSLELAESRSRMFELQKETLASQLEALKNQIDPHFLFNSLSTLSSIIEEGGPSAAGFVQELSRVYRYVLQTRSSTLVSLSEEIGFIRSYGFLMSKRFGDNIAIYLDVPEPALSLRIVPFALQLLVENAIKHNIVSAKKPLRVRVSVDGGRLVVANNLQRKTVAVPSSRVGLENLGKRCVLVTGRDILVAEGDGEFRVEVPLSGNKGEDHERPDH
jgi:hypothetical protein